MGKIEMPDCTLYTVQQKHIADVDARREKLKFKTKNNKKTIIIGRAREVLRTANKGKRMKKWRLSKLQNETH